MTSPGTSSRSVKIIVSADVAQAIRALAQTEQGLGGVGRQAEQTQKQTSTMGDVMKGALAASGIEAGISGVVGGLKSVVNGGLAYESSMNTFAAVTKRAGESSADVDAKLQAVGDTAKQLGSDITIPGASAQTAAAAMTELAKGGLSADQAMTAARGTMILAAAAQIDGAQAAEIQGNALNTFGLKAEDAGRVANVLANVANKSSGEITDFSQGLAQAGTVAAGFGWSIEETTSVLGLMANAGIKGSDAGTSLKTTMTALLNPTKSQAAALEELGIKTRDANGNMISASDLTAGLAAAKERMSAADFNAAAATAFGTDAVRTALVVAAAGTQGYDDMSAALGNVNGAQDVAAANSKGLTGIIDGLKNTIDTASLSLFQALSPALGQVTTAATGLITPLADALAPTLGSVANLATGALAPALSGVTGVLSALAGPISAIVEFFNGLPGPVGTAVFALGGVIALSGPLTATFTSAKASLVTLLATMRGTAGAAAAGSAGFAGFIASLRAASGAAATFGVVAKGALGILGGPIGLAIIGVTTALSLFSSSSDDAATSAEGFSEAIDQQTGKLKENAAEIIATKAANDGALAAYERLGGNVADYVDALGGVPGAQDKVNAKLAEARGAYDAQQAAIKEATAGSAGFAGAQSAIGSAAGKAVPSIFDLNQATDFLSTANTTLAGTTDKVRLKNEGVQGELGKTAKATTDAGNAAKTAADQATPFGDALKEIRSATQEADANLQFLNITLLQMAGNQVPADQRARALAAAYRGVGQAARDLADAHDSEAEKQATLDNLAAHLGTTLDGQAVSATNLAVTQADVDRAARDLADAQGATASATDRMKDSQDKAAEAGRNAAADAYNQAIANGNMAGAVDAAVAAIAVQREEFIKSSVDAGISREAAEELANAQGLIPENVRTTYQQQGVEAALQNARDLNAELDKTNNRTIRYYVVEGKTVQLDAPSTTGGGASSTDYLRAQAQGHADGGWVSGQGGPRDDLVPARLSPKEFVVNAAQAQKHAGLLEAINAGALGFADGGPVPGPGAVAASSAPSATAGAAVAVTAPDPAVFEAAWAAIAAAAQTAWATIILPVMQAMSAQNLQAGVEFTALASTIQVQQQGVIQPTYDALNLGAQGVGTWQQWLAGVWAQSWQSNQDRTAAGVAAIGASEMALAAVTDAAWSSIGARIQGTYDGQIVPSWAGVQGFASQVGSFFDGVNAGASAAADSTVSNIGEIQAEMNKFFDMVEGKVAANAPSGGAGVTVTPMTAMATGGIIPGPVSAKDNTIIAARTGEAVMVPEFASAVGGEAGVHRLNRLAEAGRLQAFATGGVVGDAIKSPMTAMLEQGFQSATEAVVTKALSAFPMGGGGSVVFNGNLIVDGVTAPLPMGVRGEFLKAVASQMGTSYLWGSATPPAFDCSGLLSWGLQQAGAGVGRLTAAGFNHAFPHIGLPGKPGDLATFDTGRIPGDAGHIGVILDPTRGLMMHTDGAGPARVGDYLSRDGGPLSILDVLGGTVTPSDQSDAGDPPAAGWLGGILSKIKAGGTGKGASGSYSADAGLDQWDDEILFALSFMGESPSLLGTVKNQVRTESSGNPRAINLTDSNAMRGTPSKGLVQVIDPTFAAYAMPPYNRDIWDPISNLIAGMNYARHQYGSIAQGMQGRAYENGGVLPPGFTMAWNGTGQNEFTFTKDQLLDAKGMDPTGFAAALERAVDRVLDGRPAAQFGDIYAYDPQQAMAEVEFAMARVR